MHGINRPPGISTILAVPINSAAGRAGPKPFPVARGRSDRAAHPQRRDQALQGAVRRLRLQQKSLLLRQSVSLAKWRRRLRVRRLARRRNRHAARHRPVEPVGADVKVGRRHGVQPAFNHQQVLHIQIRQPAVDRLPGFAIGVIFGYAAAVHPGVQRAVEIHQRGDIGVKNSLTARLPVGAAVRRILQAVAARGGIESRAGAGHLRERPDKAAGQSPRLPTRRLIKRH